MDKRRKPLPLRGRGRASNLGSSQPTETIQDSNLWDKPGPFKISNTLYVFRAYLRSRVKARTMRSVRSSHSPEITSCSAMCLSCVFASLSSCSSRWTLLESFSSFSCAVGFLCTRTTMFVLNSGNLNRLSSPANILRSSPCDSAMVTSRKRLSLAAS